MKLNLTKDFERLISLLARYSRPYWKWVSLLIFLNFCVTFFAMVMPLFLATILDLAFGKASLAKQAFSSDSFNLNNLGSILLGFIGTNGRSIFATIVILSLGYFVVAFLKGLVSFSGYLVALRIRVNAARDMQKDLFKHILSLSMRFFSKQRTGEIISRMEKDTLATISGLADNFLAQTLTAPVLIIFYGFLLFKTSYVLAVVGILGVILQLGISKGIASPIRRYVTDQFNIFANLSARLQEIILSIRIVKSFAAENFELKRLADEIKKVVRVNMKLGIFKHVEEPARVLATTLIEIITLLFAVRELLYGRLSATSFFMFIFIGRAIMEPISKLASIIPVTQEIIASSERIHQIFSLEPEIKDGREHVAKFSHSIKIQDVFFSYDSRSVLKSINLEIKKGEVMALVGASGAGKSTLADLILRFYDPVQGEIVIDGIDLRELAQSEYRSLFGVVPQEALLFNANIWDNIRYGREGILDRDIIEAAKVANAHDFILQLQDGYNSIIGDRGIRLSGGQRQRIAIARAVVHKPEILLLDEATSSLDSESELLVQMAIEGATKNNTAIIIAHRLSTIMRADKIVVMNKGEIISQGKHAELIEKCDLYRNLCRLQFTEKIKEK